VANEEMSAEEAIRRIRLKLDVRKQSRWSPGEVCWVEIREVETLISEVERLNEQLMKAFGVWPEGCNLSALQDVKP